MENVIGYVKKNFLYNRKYIDLETLNNQAIAWLVVKRIKKFENIEMMIKKYSNKISVLNTKEDIYILSVEKGVGDLLKIRFLRKEDTDEEYEMEIRPHQLSKPWIMKEGQLYDYGFGSLNRGGIGN